jgi:hypothetical protein
MAVRVVYGIIICALLFVALFPTASSRPNFLHEATTDSEIKVNSNTNDISEAYIEQANKAATIDVELLDDKLPKSGNTPSAPSACHNMVIDTVGAARYSC